MTLTRVIFNGGRPRVAVEKACADADSGLKIPAAAAVEPRDKIARRRFIMRLHTPLDRFGGGLLWSYHTRPMFHRIIFGYQTKLMLETASLVVDAMLLDRTISNSIPGTIRAARPLTERDVNLVR
jgi:hypothetical protein